MAASKKPQQQQSNLSNGNVIVVSAIFSVLALVAAFIIGKDLVATVRLNNKIIEKKSLAADTLKKNIDNGKKLVVEYHSLGNQAKQIEHSLPNKIDVSGLGNGMEAIISLSGARLRTLAPNDDTGPIVDSSTTATSGKEPVATPAGYLLAVTGSYQSLTTMLKHLETSSRPVNVKGINVRGNTQSLLIDLLLEGYYQDPANLSVGKEVVR